MPLNAWCQTPGLGLWTGANVQYRLGKTFELHANAQLRFSDNVTVTRAYLGEMGVSYNINKHWALAAYYRYTERLKFNKGTAEWYYQPYHRFFGELSYDHKLGKNLNLDYRLRYQNQFKDNNDALVADKSYLRNKLEFSYNTSTRLTPFVSADLFYQLGSTFDQVRYKAGLDVKLNKQQSFELSAFKDIPLGGGSSEGLVIGATYKLMLGEKKGKKN
jgi:hypothetical protein